MGPLFLGAKGAPAPKGMAYFLNLAGSEALFPHFRFSFHTGSMRAMRGHPAACSYFHTGSVGRRDVGPAPHPSLNHFFLEKRNGLEIQRKSLSLAVAACLECSALVPA